MPYTQILKFSRLGASICLISLIVLCLGWEIFWAPLRAGGSLLFLKTLPLLGPVFGILRGKRYTYQWSGMLILCYFTEGVVRAWAEQGLSSALAGIEVALSLLFFACVIVYAKYSGAKFSDAIASS